MGDFQLIGEVAGALLIGTEQSRINFTTVNPQLLSGPNIRSLTSPNATRVVPSIDARLATAYAFPPSYYGQGKVEAGYRAAVYFDAVSEYSLTNVPTSLTLPPRGIYLATAEHFRSAFTTHGPYLTASWLFGQGN
ncbi:MAG TPA: Lpg1974 family pore-forming outer membrane protein [Xanthobacteraceae bacterium]|nr:Lpg1974 family pore-forming outer membrane protein [Xanthobacteraceae bacterium]